jgi:calcineurin-like phosphoesterase family protein
MRAGMTNTYFISDTHFNHENIIKYSNRPFSSILEMNEKIIENWNMKVAPNDTIYHLGDFGFQSKLGEEYNLHNILRRLNGQKHLIIGNHDSVQNMKGWSTINNYLSTKINGKQVIMFHFPIESWDKKRYFSYHLHGHTHGMLPDDPNKLRLDVGIDAQCKDYSPISFDEVVLLMKNKTFNQTYLTEKRKDSDL